jgi:hypothetical protein
MAKAKAKAKPKSIKCKSYTLNVSNEPSPGIFSIDFVVKDQKDKEYMLQIKMMDTQTSLILKMFATICKFWPARDFTVQVDGDDQITGIEELILL